MHLAINSKCQIQIKECLTTRLRLVSNKHKWPLSLLNLRLNNRTSEVNLLDSEASNRLLLLLILLATSSQQIKIRKEMFSQEDLWT